MTPPIITRIASGETTAQDAERILALYNAAQNMTVAPLEDEENCLVPSDDVENLVSAMSALDQSE